VKFAPDRGPLVLAGAITLEPVPARDAECRYSAGRCYTIAYGGRAHGELTVTGARESEIEDVTLRECQRAGFRNPVELRAWWKTAGRGWQYAWLVSFALGDLTDTPRLLRASTPVPPICRARVKLQDGRVVTCGRAFQDKQEVCRCGAARPPARDEDHGYTAASVRAMRSEGESPSASVLAHYAIQADANRAGGLTGQHEAMQEAIGTARRLARTPRAREQLRKLEGEARLLEAALR